MAKHPIPTLKHNISRKSPSGGQINKKIKNLFVEVYTQLFDRIIQRNTITVISGLENRLSKHISIGVGEKGGEDFFYGL